MGNNDLTNSEKILIKVDQNNLVYIDPNSVVENGEIQPRGIKQENLVMYANLEADIVPRSTFISEGETTTLTQIAKGTLNFLSSQSPNKELTSNWTNSYSTFHPKDSESYTIKNPENGESFGIDSITVNVKGANFIPQVQINFIDVRGKTLFESPENSPYKAFFHLPWPIFYLTIKGFYGKAIRYRLHLVKFNSKYNDQNGNFEIQTTFVGSTYAFMNDIPLKGIINAPYMFMNESEKPGIFNTNTGKLEKKIFKSSKGYSILNSVYSEMKRKKIIPNNFPVRTLKEIGEIAETLDKILEQEIFNSVVDMNVLTGLQDYDKNLSNFESSINLWEKKYLNRSITKPINNVSVVGLKSIQKADTKDIKGPNSKDTLEGIISNFTKLLKSSELLNNDLKKDKKVKLNTRFLSKTLKDFSNYFYQDEVGVYIAIDNLKNDLFEIRKTFNEQKQKVEREVEIQMNEIIKSPRGIGFEPTVRNLFAVILANAEVYVRLLKEVHQDAFNVSDQRRTLLPGFDTETKGESIFPWPEIKKTTPTDKKTIIAYPGEPELRKTLKSDDPILWPEVAFVEEFIATSTTKTDPLTEKESGVTNINYIFENDLDKSRINEISQLFNVSDVLPYSDRSVSSFLYELYERSKLLTLTDTHNGQSLLELKEIEFTTISELLKGELDIIDTLKSEVKNLNNLKSTMEKISPFERLPFYRDNIPTLPYLKDLLEVPFSIGKYDSNSLGTPTNSTIYPNLNNDLLTYKSENYRNKIYPFNSKTYISYVNDTTSINLNGVIQVRNGNDFKSTPISSSSWVRDNFKNITKEENLFTNKIEFLDFSEHILNTPYFHKQLYSEFIKTSSNAKYVGSAYLLLNSLPFLDLDEKIEFPNEDKKYPEITLSKIFREQSATHFIPYHLVLKWGSIYHRYKTHLLEGRDILDGFLTNGVTTDINTSLFFNSGNTESNFVEYKFDTQISGATYSGNTDVGVHPFYDAIYHQTINGYGHYNVISGGTSYLTNSTKGAIRTKPISKGNDLRYWTSFVDNSKFDLDDLRYTLLPSNGDNRNIIDDFSLENQINYRTIWNDNLIKSPYSGYTFFGPDEYNKNIISGGYSLNGLKRKIIDLMGTFSPKILDQFEDLFLSFSSEKIKEEVTYKKIEGMKYDNFQDLMKEIVSVKKETLDDTKTVEEVVNLIKSRQKEKLKTISETLLNNDNLLEIKLGNPKELDPYIIEGFVGTSNNRLTFNSFQLPQVTNNEKFINLYLGPDIDGYYLEFFSVNNIELSEENLLNLRPLIYMYAGYREANENLTSDFNTYIRNNIVVPSNNRLTNYLDNLIREFSKLKTEDNTKIIDFVDGYNNKNLKIELYNFFKSFNDKWSSGNSIGNRLLIEEFLFLDKANKDIGNKAFLNIDRFISILSPKNDKVSLYSALGQLIAGSGFDMRTLPAYVNFYGNNIQSTGKIVPSEKVATNIFGTFLDVDYQESSPKTVVQFVGHTSKHLADTNKDNKFNDDSFDMSNPNNNPIMITLPQTFDVEYLNKSNKVVAFEVSFGDQNQSIFKGVTLDQSTIKNTSESFVVLENLARSESGAGTYNVDVGLFDYYRQASYSCEVTCMGNVMIQPTMYFYLKNIPMFRGSYWITEVSHSIKDNNITTTFKGTRIPRTALPDPEDSFMSSYKTLFDKLINKAKINTTSNNTTNTEVIITTASGEFRTDPGSTIIPGEVLIKNDVGITPFGIPYNGKFDEKYIQKVNYNGREWLRAVVVRMGSSKYPIDIDTQMNIITRLKNTIVKDVNGNGGLTWGELKQREEELKFYSSKFQLNIITPDKIITGKTVFLNPNIKGSKPLTITPTYSLNREVVPKVVAEGPVSVGPNIPGYGMGMSVALMKELKIYDGQVVYFNII